MSVVRWARDEALRTGPHAVDDLYDASALVLEDVSRADDAALSWWRRAPCVVVAVGCSGPSNVDVVASEDEADRVLEAIEAHPQASRVLVDVLRATDDLSVAAALVVESLAYSMLLAGPEFRRWRAANPPPAPKPLDGLPVHMVRDEDTLRITLARPANRNAFGADMRDALWEAVTFAETQPDLAVVIGGEGPAFSSGGHLAEFGTAADVVEAHRIRTLRSVGAAIDRIAHRCTVVVHGPCVGAGVELPAFSGRVVARPDATFTLPEIRMGLIPGAGGTVSIRRRIGRRRTARLALLGDSIDARTALAWGLADEVSSA